MATTDESMSFTEEVLEACRGLGRARLVLRNGVGLTELFVDLAALEVRGGWVHACVETAHLHAEVAAIAGVRFVEPGASCSCKSPAVWFAARSGAPVLLFVLDQAKGEAREEQERAFARLRDTYGEVRALMSTADLPARDAMS
jgi:hypothetical protein